MSQEQHVFRSADKPLVEGESSGGVNHSFFFYPLAVFGSQAQAAQTAGSGLPLACGGAVAAAVVASQRTGPAAELVGCGKGKFWKEFAGWTELIAQR
jgi:hypothetical protein